MNLAHASGARLMPIYTEQWWHNAHPPDARLMHTWCTPTTQQSKCTPSETLAYSWIHILKLEIWNPKCADLLKYSWMDANQGTDNSNISIECWKCYVIITAIDQNRISNNKLKYCVNHTRVDRKCVSVCGRFFKFLNQTPVQLSLAVTC